MGLVGCPVLAVRGVEALGKPPQSPVSDGTDSIRHVFACGRRYVLWVDT
jgi:hypothetical protein